MVNMKRLSNKTALITGGSSGIGQAIAIAYAAEGATVAFSYYHHSMGAEETLRLIQKNNGRAYKLIANMNDASSLYNLVEEATQCLGVIDILVNNAGTITRHPDFLAIPLDDFNKMYTVNLQAPFILTQIIAKHLKKRSAGGSIINISSMSAKIVSPGLTHYECSKTGLHALTRGSASDLARYNIRVNAIAPGLVETSMNQAQRDNDPEAWMLRNSTIPLGRAGLPSDIAGLAVFLASEEASWITGAIIPVDGGIGVASLFPKSLAMTKS